jgi:hypothetical protein
MFKNVLTIKPIFDQTGKYRFVIGIQFDITNDPMTVNRLKTIDNLLGKIPDGIVDFRSRCAGGREK